MNRLGKKIGTVLFLLTCPLYAFSQSEDFLSFLQRFSSDSAYQITRVHFPLEMIVWDSEKDEEIVIFIDKNHFSPLTVVNYSSDCSDGFFYVLPDIPLEITKMTIELRGISDISDKFWFELVDEKWYLVRYRNYDLELQ